MDKGTIGRSRRRLMIEALVAAGPRKPIEDYENGGRELCEDCAGYRVVGDFIIFWICDGTSNGHELPKRSRQVGFNSRILAQDLGEGFAKIIGEVVIKYLTLSPGIDLQKTLFAYIAEKWQNRLVEYIADVENEGTLGHLLGKIPKMAGGSYRLKWSSTFLGGVYNEQERTLDIINIGDSGAVVMGEEPKAVTPKKIREILLATLSHGDNLQVEVCPIEVDAEWEHFKGVEFFIAMSDGVSRDLNVLLHTIENDLKSVPVDEIRQCLLMRGELSYDDQSIIVGRLLPE